jgi:hypothetical protein
MTQMMSQCALKIELGMSAQSERVRLINHCSKLLINRTGAIFSARSLLLVKPLVYGLAYFQ